MSTAVSIRPASGSSSLAKAVALAIVLAVGVAFVAKYVFHYYLNYNPAGFAQYWSRRAMLLVHITSGMVALLIGPFQFSRRLRQRNIQLHRVLGRTYLVAVLLGSLAGMGLAVTTTFGVIWGFSLFCLASAWITCGAMAFYAIWQRQVDVHREWMVRTYIVTFAFVSFRLLNDYGATSRLGNPGERADVYIWASWVVPMMVASVIMQLRRMRRAAGPARVQAR
ncbi:MAG TPA: DUF2306 domain-containing protein [Terracidiphilus sp.]|nr:DUF2306 domain-containing protein [Terracidiphilus sp.]